MQAELLRVNRPKTLTIPSGETNSPVYVIKEVSFGSIQMPAEFTGTNWHVEVSNDGTNFKKVPKKTQQSSNTKHPDYTFAASECVTIWDEAFHFDFIRIVSDSLEAADRDFYLSANG